MTNVHHPLDDVFSAFSTLERRFKMPNTSARHRQILDLRGRWWAVECDDRRAKEDRRTLLYYSSHPGDVAEKLSPKQSMYWHEIYRDGTGSMIVLASELGGQLLIALSEAKEMFLSLQEAVRKETCRGTRFDS